MARTRKRRRQRTGRKQRDGQDKDPLSESDELGDHSASNGNGVDSKRRRADDNRRDTEMTTMGWPQSEGEDMDNSQIELMRQWGLPSCFGNSKLQMQPTNVEAETSASNSLDLLEPVVTEKRRTPKRPFLSEHRLETESFDNLGDFKRHLGMATHIKWTEDQDREGEEKEGVETKEQEPDRNKRATGDHSLPQQPETKTTEDVSSANVLGKFRRQRYDLFHRFDEGIHIDDEGWWSVTPESIAVHTALMIHGACPSSKDPADHGNEADVLEDNSDPLTPGLVWDAFAGVGGNTIQFALRGVQHVIATDASRERLLAASHNAEIYGVRQYIDFIQADALTMLHFWRGACPKYTSHHLGNVPGNVDGPDGKTDDRAPDQQSILAPSLPMFRAVFFSPPWGGPAYIQQPVYDLVHMLPIDLAFLLEMARTLTEELILYLPRTTDLCQLATFLLPTDRLRLEWHYLGDRLKVLIVHIGKRTDGSGEGDRRVRTKRPKVVGTKMARGHRSCE